MSQIVPAHTTNPETVSRLMSGFRRGDPAAAGQLVEVLYPELRRLAAAKISRERPDHTWQPTALVNELFLELLHIRALPETAAGDSGKADFLGFAAHLMKRLLIHHARPLSRRVEKIGIDDQADYLPSTIQGAEAMAEIDDLMNRLAAVDSKIRMVVELRIFGGLT